MGYGVHRTVLSLGFVEVSCNEVMELHVCQDSLLNRFTSFLLFTAMALHCSYLMHWMFTVCMCVILFNLVFHVYCQL
jgi:hypothetical protein